MSISFTAVGVLDGFNLKNGVKTRLSEQQLVDCSKGTNQGCNGGDAFSKSSKNLEFCSKLTFLTSSAALKHVKSKGLGTLDGYPYTKRNGQCKSVPSVVTGLPLLVKEQLNGNEARLKDIVAAVGPVAVAIDAAPSFSNYYTGIYNNPKCSKDLNHAVNFKYFKIYLIFFVDFISWVWT